MAQVDARKGDRVVLDDGRGGHVTYDVHIAGHGAKGLVHCVRVSGEGPDRRTFREDELSMFRVPPDPILFTAK